MPYNGNKNAGLFSPWGVQKLMTAWNEVWQQNDALQKKPYLRQAQVRLAKAIAVVSFWFGEKQTEDLVSETTAKSRAHFEDVSRKALAAVEIKTFTQTSNNTAVAIPCLCANRHGVDTLRKALAAIRGQTLKPRYLFVVDDGSPIPITDRLTPAEQEAITFIRHESNCSPAVARNTGLRAARSKDVEFLCFTDTDCRPSASWLESILKHFRLHPEDDIISGVTTSIDHSTIVEVFHDCFGTLNGPTLPDETLLYGPTCNLGIRLSTITFEFDSSFPEASYEDVDFCIRARDLGALLHLVPEAVVHHDYDLSLFGVWRQFAKYGRGYTLMKRIHPTFSSLCLNAKWPSSR